MLGVRLIELTDDVVNQKSQGTINPFPDRRFLIDESNRLAFYRVKSISVLITQSAVKGLTITQPQHGLKSIPGSYTEINNEKRPAQLQAFIKSDVYSHTIALIPLK